ncbi:MAG TPA: molybdopterin-dependent oxidoreductase [Acidobacteriaceae bacterium]|jgi:hypothetical protein|nr:molybdopterin-dependent oxidoreductase [Acidobacteriaceae bacterium]
MKEREAARGDAKTVKRESARRTRRSFVVGGVAAAAGYGIVHWINNSAPVGRLQSALRRTLNFDAEVNRAVWDERGLAPTYARSRAKTLRLNGTIGLERELEPESWRLQMVGVENAQASPRYVEDVTAWNYVYRGGVMQPQGPPDAKIAPGKGPKVMMPKSDEKLQAADQGAVTRGAVDLKGNVPRVNGLPHVNIAERLSETERTSGKRYRGMDEAGPSASSLNIGTPGLLLMMDDLMRLPKVEFVTEFKCIEGWSEITEWGGVRLRDLIEAYPPAKINGREPRYVYMETPDGNYYCGYDMSAARHPQSLLVTEMGGEPLKPEHGAPLRLHMPIKYGYKQLKRIGLIAYMDAKPDDYWMKLGYDWYAGL